MHFNTTVNIVYINHLLYGKYPVTYDTVYVVLMSLAVPNMSNILKHHQVIGVL